MMIEDNAIFLFVRRLIGWACVPVLVVTGWRFTKNYRQMAAANIAANKADLFLRDAAAKRKRKKAK